MRFAHSFTPWCVAAAALTTLPSGAWAQTAPPAPADHTAAAPGAEAAPPSRLPDWLQPTAPSRPLQHLPLPASGGVEQASTPWQAANAAVAQFPRGHTDVLQREKAQAGTPPAGSAHHPPAPAAPTAAPAAGEHQGHHHGGQP
ncbi:hypothetical protein [Comamonas terrigena]|uniref:hypothetical protein n=1 Tax=Comamonas terrigena TaxID=32013 RepID=UPI00082A6FBD|nr:hypothetical protein [Comamonas terrigena]BBL25244.1 hypothetical protein CT3_26990 [Comamonas terrigena NBRC 13299]SUY71175.1 Uncharacterised protein [Comamonas terrigena]